MRRLTAVLFITFMIAPLVATPAHAAWSFGCLRNLLRRTSPKLPLTPEAYFREARRHAARDPAWRPYHAPYDAELVSAAALRDDPVYWYAPGNVAHAAMLREFPYFVHEIGLRYGFAPRTYGGPYDGGLSVGQPEEPRTDADGVSSSWLAAFDVDGSYSSSWSGDSGRDAWADVGRDVEFEAGPKFAEPVR